LAQLRAAGVAPATVVAALAASAGLGAVGEALTVHALLERFGALATLPRAPAVINLDLGVPS
jgi:hypothetical protein